MRAEIFREETEMYRPNRALSADPRYRERVKDMLEIDNRSSSLSFEHAVYLSKLRDDNIGKIVTKENSYSIEKAVPMARIADDLASKDKLPRCKIDETGVISRGKMLIAVASHYGIEQENIARERLGVPQSEKKIDVEPSLSRTVSVQENKTGAQSKPFRSTKGMEIDI